MNQEKSYYIDKRFNNILGSIEAIEVVNRDSSLKLEPNYKLVISGFNNTDDNIEQEVAEFQKGEDF